MKKVVQFLFLLLSIESYAQITLDFQSPNHLNYIKLNNSETKYVDEYQLSTLSQNYFNLYNLDGTLYKIIQLPQKPDPLAYTDHVSCISTNIFDNDPSSIEYFISYEWDSANYLYQNHQVRIIREDGTILLEESNAIAYYWVPLIFGSEEGTKLILYYEYANGNYIGTKVFSLPGEPPVGLNEEGIEEYTNPSIYPNPNNGLYFIKFQLKEGESSKIDLYTGNGKLINSYKSSGNLIQINNSGLSNGLYLINTHSKSVNSTTKMVIEK